MRTETEILAFIVEATGTPGENEGQVIHIPTPNCYELEDGRLMPPEATAHCGYMGERIRRLGTDRYDLKNPALCSTCAARQLTVRDVLAKMKHLLAPAECSSSPDRLWDGPVPTGS